MGSLNASCRLSTLRRSLRHGWWRLSTASSALGGAGKALGGSVQTAVQTAAPSLNNVSDPMAAIESKVRSISEVTILRRFAMLR